jgi:hypothetical protein
MAPTVSCFYINYNRDPVNIIFINFDNFIKVMFNRRSIILTKNQLVFNHELFQIYVISLILTEDTSKVKKVMIDDKVYYGISTMRYWKNLYLTNFYKIISLEKSAHRNPLNAREPKRESSQKKYNKFIRSFYNYYYSYDGFKEGHIVKPCRVLNEYYLSETSEIVRYLEHQTQVEALIFILHNYGRDIYTAINKYIKLS